MNINEKEELAAERVIQTAYGEAMKYSKGEDMKAATLGLLWAAFQNEAREMGLTPFDDMPIK
jgi:hypothetical protein